MHIGREERFGGARVDSWALAGHYDAQRPQEQTEQGSCYSQYLRQEFEMAEEVKRKRWIGQLMPRQVNSSPERRIQGPWGVLRIWMELRPSVVGDLR